MTSRAAPTSGPRPVRRGWARIVMTLASVAGVALFLGLGIWQVQRLQWKVDLIARVEARLAAPAVPDPEPEAWSSVNRTTDEYRRVHASGRYDFAAERLVQAVTAQGPGFWVMTPLDTGKGWSVWINRGFVPQDRREPADRAHPENVQDVSGLLRITQPDGAFLRDNDPAAGRWYSRDVDALSADTGLGRHAPYFIDADATSKPGDLPAGGLTVVSFRNSHLSYALTWFAMAAGLAIGAFYVLRRDRAQE